MWQRVLVSTLWELSPFAELLVMSLKDGPVLPGGLPEHRWVKRGFVLAKPPFSPKINDCHSPPLQEWAQALGLVSTG